MSSVLGLEPGDSAIPFDLPNANPSIGGTNVRWENIITDLGAAVLFTCNHCPYVIGSISRIRDLSARMITLGFGFVSINSNDSTRYPEDGWDHMVKASGGMDHPYLHDESQAVASAWGAERTPEIYLIDCDGIIRYRGRIDDSPQNPSNISSHDFDNAFRQLLNDETIDTPRTDSIGCSVKWKA